MPNKLNNWNNLTTFGKWLVVIAVLVPLFSFAQTTAEEEPEELEAFVMVGSRIKQIDQVTVNPVISITRDDIDSSGFSTVGEAIRSLSFNSGQSLTDDTGSSTFGYGSSTANFRGIGNNNVLMLVNGRRAAPFGSPASDGYQSVFDLDSLPASAIESVNILKDGGSAIYGSDAVSGVIDIRLRRDFEGVNTSIRYGDYTGDINAAERSASVVFGTSTAKTSIVVTADYTSTENIYARELSWQGKNADLRSYVDAGDLQAWQDWSYGEGGAPDDYFYKNYGDQRSSYGYPARVTVPGLGDFTFNAPTSNPTVEGAVEFDNETNGRYDFAQDYTYSPSKDIRGFYTSVKHDFTENLYGFLELSYRQSEIQSGSAPAPMVGTDQGDAPNGGIMLPAGNPFNPWGVDITSWRYRAVEAGNRTTDATITTPRILFGLGGDFLEDWTWEVGFLTTKSDVNSINSVVFDDRLQSALNGVLLADYQTDEARVMYLNPFGSSEQEVIDYISGPNPNTAYTKVNTVDFNASGTLFELPAGSIGLAVGGEYRKESYAETATDSNRSGNIVGGSWYDSSEGDRNVKSLYAEVSIPVISWIDVQLAARYEDYSDFGTTTKPKLAIKLRPFESLLLRASYGESFLAPNLAYLYTSEKVTFTSSNYLDPLRIEGNSRQMEQHGGGNPLLDPEETATTYFGAKWEPSGVLRGFYVELEYFSFDTENLISDVDAEDMLHNEESAIHYTNTGNIVRFAPEDGEEYGQIFYLNTYYQNLGRREYKGYDLSLGYNLKTEKLGEFDFQLNGTLLEEYVLEETVYTNYETYPEYVGSFMTSWNKGDWGATVFLRYTAAREGELSDPEEPKVNGFNVYEAQLTTNASVSYDGFANTRVSVGVTNLFDEAPPLSLWGDYGTSTGTVNTKPRFWFVSIEKDW